MAATVLDPVDPAQAHIETVSLGYVWDVPTLTRVRGTQPAAGGGAATIADGADVAQGSVADVAWVSGNGTVISLLKTIAGGSAVTVADGADVAEGATAEIIIPVIQFGDMGLLQRVIVRQWVEAKTL